MESNISNPGSPSPSFFGLLVNCIARLYSYFAAGVFKIAELKARYSALIFSALKITLGDILLILHHSTITLRYHLRLRGLTCVAYVTGRSFIIRRPHHLPTFIGRPGSIDVHTFELTEEDILSIYVNTGIHVGTADTRQWRSEAVVKNLVSGHNVLNHPRLDTYVLKYCRLVGDPLVQGRGLIGHGMIMGLIEEYGRCPGHATTVFGKIYSWKDGALFYGKFPLNLFPPPTIDADTRDGVIPYCPAGEGLEMEGEEQSMTQDEDIIVSDLQFDRSSTPGDMV